VGRGELYPLDGKVVLVTGAARGIGAESARRLAARGAKVSLVGLEPELLAQVAAGCGEDAAWFEADVTSEEQLQAAIDGTVERFGGIDVCVANAGIGAGGMVRLMEPRALARVVEINMIGTINTLRLCLPHVIERRGYMLPVSSRAAIAAGPGTAAYAATKAGVETFANSLRMEVAHLGVDVGVAYFSWVDTDLARGSEEHVEFKKLRESLKGPMGRTYPVSEAADAIVRGVEERARWAMSPGWIRWMLYARGLMPLIVERQLLPLMPEVDRIAEEEAERVGAERLSAPVGAGGEAALRAERERSGAARG
jgi:NAD(P)-dependent dehydrogenase (short-subunit alcohol dehydrogenase family)